MRQAQQNRRGRGRNNNNRNKSQNPLTRSFESNGPDVKIRGTPSHIAEKYVTMARDALSSGDPVLAENYLQHAEHYNRIIMTHREQQATQAHDNGQPNQNSQNARQRDDDGRVDNRADENVEAPRGSEPQPSISGDDRQPGEREERRPQRRNSRRERAPNRDRGSADSGDAAVATSAEQPAASGRSEGNGRGGRRTRYAQSDDQPEFLKRPVRRPRASAAAADDDAPAPAAPSDEAAE